MTNPANFPPNQQPSSGFQPYPPYPPYAPPPSPAPPVAPAPPPLYGRAPYPPQPGYPPSQPAYAPPPPAAPAHSLYPPQPAPPGYSGLAQPSMPQSAASSLGAYERPYTINTGMLLISGVLFALIGVVLTIAGILAFSNPANSSNAGFLIGGVVLLVVATMRLIIPAIRTRGARIEMYTGGFVYARGRKRQAIRWEDIAEIYRERTEREIEFKDVPVYKFNLYRYTIVTRTGQRVFLKNQRGIKQLGETIQRRTNAVLMPRMMAALQAGAAVPFGKLIASAQGVRHGATAIPWSEIQSVWIEKGELKISRRGQWLSSWVTVPMAKTPNALLFLALVQTITGIKAQEDGE